MTLAFGVIVSGFVCVGSEAGSNAMPSQSQVVRCLRHAGWTAQATAADGAQLIFATSGKVNWTISLAPPKPHAGWSGKPPTVKQRATLARCLN